LSPRDFRIRGSLERYVGDAAASDAQIRALAARVWMQGRAITFLLADLDAMPAMARALIEGEARRIYGPRKQQ
jgi:hypothetical protein